MQLHRRRVKAGDVFAGMPFVKRGRLIGFVDTCRAFWYRECLPSKEAALLAGEKLSVNKRPPCWFIRPEY